MVQTTARLQFARSEQVSMSQHIHVQPHPLPHTTHTHTHYCRDISSVCGFTSEVLVAVVADIETVEWRSKYLLQHALPPEHVRMAEGMPRISEEA